MTYFGRSVTILGWTILNALELFPLEFVRNYYNMGGGVFMGYKGQAQRAFYFYFYNVTNGKYKILNLYCVRVEVV